MGILSTALEKIARSGKPLSANAMFFIRLRKESGVWHFTDKSRGLVKEPLVCGIPEILEDLLQEEGVSLSKASKGLTVSFSGRKFPGSTCLNRRKLEMGGAWYALESGEPGWLCPALLKFFKTAPPKLWVSLAL